MTLVARHANPSITTPAPAFNHRLAGGHEGWKAGEALDAADACTLHSDGRVYKADGAAADANARIYGWTAGPCPVGEAVTLFDHVTFGYAAGGLTPGALFYLSGDTPGRLDTEPSPGGTVPCAVALDSTRVHVQSTWGGGATSGGGALTATYLDLPAITAPDPMTQPLNHAWVYLDSADMTLQALINGTAGPLGGGSGTDPVLGGSPAVGTPALTLNDYTGAPAVTVTGWGRTTIAPRIASAGSTYTTALVLGASNLGGGTPPAGFGVAAEFDLATADGVDVWDAGYLECAWSDPDDSAPVSDLVVRLAAFGQTALEWVRFLGKGGMQLTATAAANIANPPAGCITLYADSADNHLKKKLPDGTVVDLG